MNLFQARTVLQSVAKVKSRNIYEVTIRLAEEFFFIKKTKIPFCRPHNLSKLIEKSFFSAPMTH